MVSRLVQTRGPFVPCPQFFAAIRPGKCPSPASKDFGTPVRCRLRRCTRSPYGYSTALWAHAWGKSETRGDPDPRRERECHLRQIPRRQSPVCDYRCSSQAQEHRGAHCTDHGLLRLLTFHQTAWSVAQAGHLTGVCAGIGGTITRIAKTSGLRGARFDELGVDTRPRQDCR